MLNVWIKKHIMKLCEKYG